MLSNKNNKINPFKSITLNPLLGFKRSWYISIKPLYSLIMLLGIGICLAAGIWQYQKSQFYLAPVAQQVHMKGHYLNEYTHFLDNQTLHGRAGYAVITPFVYEASVYLVNRGFVSYESRDQLPRVTPIIETATLTGLVLTNNIPMLLNSRFVVKDIFHLKQGAGLQTLMPVKSPYLSHHRHQGYALQWLLLAVAGLIILVLSSIKTGLKMNSPSGEKL